MRKKKELGQEEIEEEKEPIEVEPTREQLDELFERLDRSIKAWLDVKVPKMVENKIDALREDNIKIEIIKKLVG